MLTQNARVYNQLMRGPVSQFWGVNQIGDAKILRLAARIKDLKAMGCEIKTFKESGCLYYNLVNTPDGLALNLQAQKAASDCRNQSGCDSQPVGLFEQMSFA